MSSEDQLKDFEKKFLKNKGNIQQLDKPKATESKVKSENSPEESDMSKILGMVTEMKEKVDKVTSENSKLFEENKRLKEERDDKRQAVKTDKEIKAVTDVIQGYQQKFHKVYDFPVTDGEDIHLDITMKAPTAGSQAAITNFVVAATDGMEWPADASKFKYEAMGALLVLGEEVPAWLSDLDTLTRTDIPVKIYSDYLAWWDKFYQYRRQ